MTIASIASIASAIPGGLGSERTSTVIVDGLAHQRWWAATTSVTSLVLAGDLVAARERALQAFEIGSALAHSGALAVLLLQIWQLDDLDDAPESLAAAAVANRALIDHPLSALVAASALARAGNVDEAARWGSWAGRWIVSQQDPEKSWTLILVMAADLATELITLGNRNGTALADIVRDRIASVRHLVAVDSRGVVCLGPVARAEAALLLAQGHLDDALASYDLATEQVERLSSPPVHVAELGLLRARLDRAAGVGDTAVMLSTVLGVTERAGMTRLRRETQHLVVTTQSDRHGTMLTDRQTTVLRLIGQGLSNREIAERLNFSISTIAKETMHVYRRLGLADREAAIALMRSTDNPTVLPQSVMNAAGITGRTRRQC